MTGYASGIDPTGEAVIRASDEQSGILSDIDEVVSSLVNACPWIEDGNLSQIESKGFLQIFAWPARPSHAQALNLYEGFDCMPSSHWRERGKLSSFKVGLSLMEKSRSFSPPADEAIVHQRVNE